MKIQVISPHPDDLEISCSGTLLSFQQQGHDITSIITVCPSEESNPDRNRKTVETELSQSYKISTWPLKIFDTDLHSNGRPNLRHDNVTMTRLSHLIEYSDLIILPNPNDYHQDHVNTYHLCLPLALKRCRTIWTMHGWPYCYHHNIKPNLFRDITPYWSTKKQLLDCYSSYITPTHIDQIKRLNQVWGDQNQCELAEAFTVVIDRG